MSKKVRTSKEDTLATELFCPKLSNEYKIRFDKLINKLGVSLMSSRENIIISEIKNVKDSTENINDDFEALKYLTSLCVLIDLSKQGWIFDIHDSELTLRMENENVDDKDRIRYRLSAERNAQFKEESIKEFIKKMESEKIYNDSNISIVNLIGDKNILIERINDNDHVICDPYIQLVTDKRDELTGYKLSDIWRYFRYTWSIPYKTMPGRNLFYLVRDRSQEYHPIIGIFALGNSVLNLSVRDDDIGWTVDAIKNTMKRLESIEYSKQSVSETNGKSICVKRSMAQETPNEHQERIKEYADKVMPLLRQNILDSIKEIYIKDLGFHRQTRNPSQDQIDKYVELASELSKIAVNNKNNNNNPNWEEEAKTNLFKKKRAIELSKLLSAQKTFNSVSGNNCEQLTNLLSTDEGRKAINTALIANRKCKIGSNMMEIIVCGSIPPYNELLGGKLISILSCSPIVIRDYTKKYEKQISEIASRMKGERVIRDSHLAYLGTTSLYSIGSSQYNRIKVPIDDDFCLQYRKIGVTEGYGTVYFSKHTTNLFSRLLEINDGAKKISHVFGEGTSPRFRIISRGLGIIGINAPAFLQHYSPRIVYSINLAKNTNEFLMGFDSSIDYGFDLNSDTEVDEKTMYLINYWKERWMLPRLGNVDIVRRLEDFDYQNLLLSNN